VLPTLDLLLGDPRRPLRAGGPVRARKAIGSAWQDRNKQIDAAQ
jgi:hypothetical protein